AEKTACEALAWRGENAARGWCWRWWRMPQHEKAASRAACGEGWGRAGLLRGSRYPGALRLMLEPGEADHLFPHPVVDLEHPVLERLELQHRPDLGGLADVAEPAG